MTRLSVGKEMKKCRIVLSVATAALLILSATLTAADLSESEQIAELLGITPGQTVADVGAGDGQFSVALAKIVGPRGRVFATEVDKSEIRKIEKAVSRAKLDNVSVVQGTATDSGLEPESCDAILLRTVFHHLSDPDAMVEELLSALKPGGSIAVIEFAPRRNNHGSKPEEVISQMEARGFEKIEHLDSWRGGRNYLLLLRKPPTS